MLETYREMRERQQKEFNALNMKFAFSQSQFVEMLDEFGVNKKEASAKLVSIGNGGYMLKEEIHTLKEQMDKSYKELQKAIKSDKDGTGFIKEMFKYEMWNYEYAYSLDEEALLDACSLDIDEVLENEALKNGYILARQEYFKEFNELNA